MSLSFPWLHPLYETLCSRFQQGQLHHAVLFSGQGSIGKASLARTFAARLLCSGDTSFACGQCKSCLLLASDTHPDLTVLTTEEKSRFIKIDQVRAVIDKLSGSAQQGGNKVVIVDRADQLNVNAANALLKSLEEPTPNTYFLLLSNGTERLLPTVISRCYLQVVATPSQHQALNWLQGFASGEEEIKTALHIARGSPLLAKKYLQAEGGFTLEDIFKALSSCASHSSSVSATAKTLEKADLAEEVVPVLHAAIRHAISTRMSASPVVPEAVAKLAQCLLDKMWSIDVYFGLLEACQTAKRQIASPSNPNHQLLLEDLLIRMSMR